MNHDPMCTWQDFTAVDCHECDLLAKVRADERAEVLHAAEQAVEAALNTGLSNSSDNALYFYELDEDDPTLGYNVTFPKGSLIAAIRALREEK